LNLIFFTDRVLEPFPTSIFPAEDDYTKNDDEGISIIFFFDTTNKSILLEVSHVYPHASKYSDDTRDDKTEKGIYLFWLRNI